MKLAKLPDIGAVDAHYEAQPWSIRRSAFFILGCSAAVWILIVYGLSSLI